MFNLKLPTKGLTVVHQSPIHKDNSSKELPQIIQLNVVENVTKEILKSIRNNEQVRLKLGKRPVVQYGKKQVSLDHASNEFPTEVLVGPLDGSEPVYFSGKLSHTLEVQKANQAVAGTDEALAALENTLKSMKEQQASKEASFVGMKNDSKARDTRPASLNNRDRLRGTTTPSSPFLGASPRLGPTSNPLTSTGPSKEKIRQDAMRIPLVHLLAMGPMASRSIAKKLNATQSDCDKVLDKVAKDGSGGNKELKERCFRELDVWKFPYQNKDDRDAAIEHAIHAYDRMRIDKNDPLWQMLLPKEERGKGKVLSRLNFAPPAPTPRLGLDNESKAEASDKEGKVKKSKGENDSKDPSAKKRPTGETSTKKPRAEKAIPKSTAQSAKVESKFKSFERIEDSDEEAKGVEVVPAKSRDASHKEQNSRTVPSRNTASVSGSSQHKSKLSSSSNDSGDLDRSRSHQDRTKLKPRPHAERSPSNSRISPRPRVDSSPQKPSPLGSSPPTNSTDLEHSSKSSTQSSAPSSPPSSTDMPLSQARRTYSPVIAGKGANKISPVKRKAEKGGDPPAKRQQVHGLGLPKTLTENLQQPTPERRFSDASASSPEKQAVTKESVLDATLKFREYYDRYEALHVRLNRLDPDLRSDKDLDQLWKMHERLGKIKAELWSDWGKAGGEISV